MPWLRAHRAEAHTRGRTEGRAEARAEIAGAFRRKLLAARGLSGVSDEEIIDALLENEDRTDFLARLERPRR